MDKYFVMLSEYIQDMRTKGRIVREIDCGGEANELIDGLPIRVGEQTRTGVILKADTFLELGNPTKGSCSFLLWTSNVSLMGGFKIILVGHDIQESVGQSLPFGQVIMIGGASLTSEHQDSLEAAKHVSDKIEGYMVRSVEQGTWSRVSKDVATKGFCFGFLGRALMGIFKSEIANIEAMEIVFVTSSREDVEQLNEIASQVRARSREMRNEAWKAKGIDIDCSYSWNCKNCPEKKVCDEIKKHVKNL